MADNKEPLVLVIDDQDDILQIVSLTLRYEGWRVATARNGKEGLAAVRAETPALILADLMMPEMTGIEFCRHLLEEFGLKEVPVLMISGVNEKAKILNDFWEMPLRHHNFLHKPFSTDELLSAVQSILPQRLTKYPAQQVLAAKPPPTPEPAAIPPQGGTPQPTVKPIVAPFNPEASHGFRILVVDDDPDIRMILKTALGMFHVVEEAENGVEGLEMVDHFGPDIVLSDINMPQMNGLDMAEAIRRHPAYCAVPIFFLTGETDTSLPRKAFDIGGNLYLRKPVDPIQLLKFIDHFLKEIGLQPGQLHALARQRTPQGSGIKPAGGVQMRNAECGMRNQKSDAPAPAPAPPQGGTPKPQEPRRDVRVLVIDFNFEHHRLLRELFEGQGGDALRVPGGPFEMLYAEELALAMGNLTRWEPDLVLYNPRTPGMPDGIAFGQNLRLRKLTQAPEVAFIGERFYDSEADYSRNTYKRGVIDLTRGDRELARMLGEAAATARIKVKAKQYPIAQLREEELERQRKVQATSAREARQREIFRQKYAILQEFIDHQL